MMVSLWPSMMLKGCDACVWKPCPASSSFGIPLFVLSTTACPPPSAQTQLCNHGAFEMHL